MFLEVGQHHACRNQISLSANTCRLTRFAVARFFSVDLEGGFFVLLLDKNFYGYVFNRIFNRTRQAKVTSKPVAFIYYLLVFPK